MYSRSNTWLENGPAGMGAFPQRGRVIVLPGARRGVAGLYDNCTWWPPVFAGDTPSCWNVAVADPIPLPGGSAYETAQYGKIPRPQDLPSPPIPNVPAPQDQRSVGVAPPGITAADWSAWTQSQRDYIQAAIDAGTYNPAGNLPFNAIDFANFWDRYGTALMLVGVAGLAFVGYKVATK